MILTSDILGRPLTMPELITIFIVSSFLLILLALLAYWLATKNDKPDAPRSTKTLGKERQHVWQKKRSLHHATRKTH